MASSLSAPGALIARQRTIGRPSARRGISRAVLDLFSFEALFTLFLFAGRFKADPRFSWVPIDITALLFGASVISGFLVLLRRNLRIPRRSVLVVLPALAFVFYACVSLAWTPGRIYARQKAFYLATLTLWPLVAGALIIAPDRRRLRRFLTVVVLFAGWLSLESTVLYLTAGRPWFITPLGGNYLGLGRTVGLGALILLSYVLFFARSGLSRMGAVVVLAWHMLVSFVSGARGPLLATIVAGLVPLFSGIRPVPPGKLAVRRYVMFLVALLAIAGMLTVYLFSTGNLPFTLGRMLSLFVQEGGGRSASARADLYTDAMNLWIEAPFCGHGIGAWPVLRGVGDSRSYPHNLVLEILVELGLVGLILFSTLCFFGLKALGSLRHVRNDPWRLLILMLFVNVFLNAMVSGDLPDNRLVLGILGLTTLGKNEVPGQWAGSSI